MACQSWTVRAWNAGNFSGACSSGFPCLPAVFSFSRSGSFTGLCTFVDLSSPFISDLSVLLPRGVVDTKGLRCNFERVFETLLLTTLGAFTMLQLTE